MTKEVYQHLFKTYGQNKWMWVSFFMEAIRKVIIRIYLVFVVADITTNITRGDKEAAYSQTIYYLVAYIVGVAFGFVADLIASKVDQDEYSRHAKNYHQKLVGKDMSFYRDHQTGYISGTYRQYCDGMMQLVRFLRGEAQGIVISLISIPIVLLYKYFEVGVVATIIVITQVAYIKYSSSKTTQYRRITSEAYRKVSGEISDEITNITAFKSGGFDITGVDKVNKIIDEESASFRIRRRMSTFLDLPRTLITGIGVWFTTYVIVVQMDNFDSTMIGLVVMVLVYMFQINRNIGSVPEMIMNHDDFIVKIHQTLPYLTNEYENIKDIPNPKPLIIKDAKIKIENLVFNYISKDGTSVNVFNDLNLHIKAGEHIGIVGLSGAGKSTLANLILRFDETTSGTITIDGVNIKDVEQATLRASIAYVPQEPLLFHRTVKENISYYQPKATDGEITRVAQISHCDDFISQLPQKYNTMVGERGVKLSGGQKQRIAIARALLKKSSIIIFDEATSALDSESEQIIQSALPEIIQGKTALIIAHRLSTIASLDRIIVMDNGRISEQGTHAELIKKQGIYSSLWKKQSHII